jgi:hypothetical protein
MISPDSFLKTDAQQKLAKIGKPGIAIRFSGQDSHPQLRVLSHLSFFQFPPDSEPGRIYSQILSVWLIQEN